MTNYIFVRHGESEANLQKVYGGHSMTPLTSLGKQQAKETGNSLKNKNITMIITSDLTRAFDTAHIIADMVGFDSSKLIVTPLLREVDSGEFTGIDIAQGVTILEKGNESQDGESIGIVKNRGEQCISFLKKLKASGDILVVGHNSFHSVIFSLLDGKDDLLAYRKNWHMDNASIREVQL